MSGCPLSLGLGFEECDVVRDRGGGDEAGAALVDGTQSAGSELFVDDGAAHGEDLHGVWDAVKLRFGEGHGGHAAPPSMPRRRGVSVTSVTSVFSQVKPVTGCWLSRIDP